MQVQPWVNTAIGLVLSLIIVPVIRWVWELRREVANLKKETKSGERSVEFWETTIRRIIREELDRK